MYRVSLVNKLGTTLEDDELEELEDFLCSMTCSDSGPDVAFVSLEFLNSSSL